MWYDLFASFMHQQLNSVTYVHKFIKVLDIPDILTVIYYYIVAYTIVNLGAGNLTA